MPMPKMATIPFEGNMPEEDRQDQFFRIIRTLMGSTDPMQMNVGPEEYKRQPADMIPLFSRDGQIGQTYTRDEQQYFQQLLQALASDPLLSRVLTNEYTRYR